MSKKYKNTQHKNPFREDRPKRPFPWLTMLFSVLFVTAGVLISLLVYNNFGSGIRKFTTDAPGIKAYDPKNGVTYYYDAMTSYQAAKLKEPYAACGVYTFYEIEGVDPEIMLHVTMKDGEDEILYGLYCVAGYKFPEPSELVISSGSVLQTDLEAVLLSRIERDDASQIMSIFLEREDSKRPTDIDGDSILDICLFSENYPYLSYMLIFLETESGDRYISCRETGRYIKLETGELDSIFPEE